MSKGIITSLVLVLFFTAPDLYSQQIKPRGQFLSDSIKIGVPVRYTLTVKYPKEIDVVFPDSLYNYEPYELDRKEYFPTRSDSTLSYDSAVYYITSFEVDSLQRLQLPVFVLHGHDSTAVYPAEDTIILKHLVSEIPDSVAVEAMPLKENTTYKKVFLQLNYPYIIIGALIIIVVAVLIIMLFGAKIKQLFKMRRMKKSHKKFIEKYDSLVLAKDRPVKKQSEEVLALWKKYLEKLEVKPYTQLTTKEIIEYYKPQHVGEDLRTLDRVIYSNEPPKEELMGKYTALKKYSQQRYEEKIEEVKHG